MKKYQNLIKIYNNIKSDEFNEILLYLFESQCQSYFSQILAKYKNEYNEKCCDELLNKLSLGYLKKAIIILYENNEENNLLNLYAIAYLKTYCYYYVEINYKYFDKVNFEQINQLLTDKEEDNEIKSNIRKMRNIYIWRVYCKKFENYEQFMDFNFPEHNIPIYKELQEVIKKEEENDTPYIFSNCFISPKKINNYKEFLLKDIEQFKDITKENINKDFDSFYCYLVNKSLSYLYSKDKEKTIKDLNFIYNNTYDKIDFDEEGKKLYNILLNYDLFEKEIITNIYDDELKQDDF